MDVFESLAVEESDSGGAYRRNGCDGEGEEPMEMHFLVGIRFGVLIGQEEHKSDEDGSSVGDAAES